MLNICSNLLVCVSSNISICGITRISDIMHESNTESAQMHVNANFLCKYNLFLKSDKKYVNLLADLPAVKPGCIKFVTGPSNFFHSYLFSL